ncbi:MAG: hypothetical protein ACRDO9_01975 [Gaiellales bacterium]
MARQRSEQAGEGQPRSREATRGERSASDGGSDEGAELESRGANAGDAETQLRREIQAAGAPGQRSTTGEKRERPEEH